MRGEWVGYVEQFEFSDGSDVVKVAVDDVKANEVVARVTLGRGPAERPDQSDAGSPPPLELIVGIPLAARGTIAGQRLKLEVPLDVWSTWCTAQKPRAGRAHSDDFGCPTDGYSYRGDGGCSVSIPQQYGPDGGPVARHWSRTEEPFECEKLIWCNRLRMRCTCTAGACRALPPTVVRFDFRMRGNEADGSVNLRQGLRNVRLTHNP